MPLAAGTTLGQYEIRSALGAGGMGEVYRAYDNRLQREVAIKVLPESLTSDPERLRRFEQEARVVAALNHPNILAVYQMATHNGVSYMVTEFLDGETLRERLTHAPIPLRKAIDYAVQIAHGLAAAHDKGITHRDLKPENLFVTKDGRIKILDFGLAKVGPPRDGSGAEATVDLGTEPGTVMGTAGYMSPEQVRGKTADHRSDIFAFGAILYELVTGKQTFRKPTSADTMAAILKDDPPPISQIAPTAPPGLQRVVHRCLEKDPEQRFHSAHDLAFALEALSDSSVTTPARSHAQQKQSWSRRRIAAVAVAAALVLAAALFAYWRLRPEHVPKVSNYAQLTHDGQPKDLIGIEGSRLYLYLSGRDSLGLAEMSISGGEPKKLPILPSTNTIPLGLSPDGTSLLAVDRHGGLPPTGPIWSIPLLGGSPRRIGDTIGNNAALSPDGKALVYCNGNTILIANADGSESRTLVTLKNPAWFDRFVWSPDGTHLRFELQEVPVGLRYLWEVSADGTGLHRLLPGWNHPPDWECCGKWTPDGEYFVFQSRGQIWALPRKGFLFNRDPKPIQLTSSPLILSDPWPSADGKKLYVVGKGLRGELVRYDSKAGTFIPFLAGISAEHVAFSKNGQWVAYIAYPEGTLWRSRIDGSERVRLTNTSSRAFEPRWSPDGTAIVFYTDSPQKIYQVSAEGGTASPLIPAGPDEQFDPNWSPDGGKIVFSGIGFDPKSAIRVFNLATHQITTLPESQGKFSPRWSPDGRYICALSADLTRLLVFDFQTQKWSELAKGNVGFPSWSKDGQYLQLLDLTGKTSVIRIRLKDAKMERIVDLKDFSQTGYWGVWLGIAPDDSPLLLRDTGTQDVYSLDWQEP